MKKIKELVIILFYLYNWEKISKHKFLSEEFIEKYQDRVNWNWICANQKLSESFIEKYQDKVYWNLISVNQKLSESFIKKFQDRVYWYLIYINPTIKLSERFVLEFYNNYEYEIFNIIKQTKPELKEFCLEVEQQIPRLLLEFDLKPSVELY